MFDRKGYIAIERDGLTVDEETMFEDVLEAGAEDLQTSPEVFEIYTAPEDLLLYEMSWKRVHFGASRIDDDSTNDD